MKAIEWEKNGKIDPIFDTETVIGVATFFPSPFTYVCIVQYIRALAQC